jgi:hypothetical protein
MTRRHKKRDVLVEQFRVQRSGLKKHRQPVLKGLCLYLVINPFHSMGYDGYAGFRLIV